jgi:DNA-binding transcriptional MerR regulator
MPKTLSAAPLAATHPIQVVARRTGLSPDVIRAWEKRYAVVVPLRTENGRRLYSDADIERLGLLARVTLTGRMIGQVAGLPTAQLVSLVSADDPAPTEPAGLDLHAYLEAVGRFDAAALDALLRRAVVTLSAEAFLDALVVPFWERIGERMRAGTLRDSQRHLALAVLRRALYRMIEVATSPLAAPDLLVANQSVQPQDLGALLAAAAAAAEGWRVTHVGPGLPATEIAETAAHIGARAVLLSLGTAPTDRVLPRELRQLRGLLPRDVNILVEGAGGNGQRGVSREIGAMIVRDLPALRAWLRTHAAAS